MIIRNDLENYKKVALRAALFMFVILLILAFLTRSSVLIGVLIGSSLASINVFVLAIAAYNFLIKKINITALSWPLGFFLILCGVGFYLAINFPNLALGFAVGLTSPLVLASIIAYQEKTSKNFPLPLRERD